MAASDGGARFECALDDGARRGCSSPLRLAGLGQGRHTVRVRALTDAGGPDPTPATASWTVDTIAPTTQIDHFSQTRPDSVALARVRAVDRAGNVGPPASRTFNL